jgi:hypothetical protein
MDLSNYWQENKRFLTLVGVGLVVFFIGLMVIDNVFGDELRAQRGALSRVQGELRSRKFTRVELDVAQAENERLREVVGRLAEAVEFEPRPEFTLQGESASNRYFSVVSNVREDLRSRAGRAGLSIPEDLGLPALSPTREAEVERYLEALDVIDQTVRLAIEAGATFVDSIKITLDGRVLSRKPIEDLETTRVEFKLSGAGVPLTRLLAMLQEPRHGRTLLVQRVSMQPARLKQDEVKLEFELIVAHLHGLAPEHGARP